MTLERVYHVQGFMQLMMKERNGLPWSDVDKAAIRVHLRGMAHSFPILLLFTLPGGTLLLPLLAWFLDRRKRAKPLPAVAAVEDPLLSQVVTAADVQQATEKEKRIDPSISVSVKPSSDISQN